MAAYAMGERVIASVNGTGSARAGFVTGVLPGPASWFAYGGQARYMVHFDGDRGHSGPCVVIRAEGEREDMSPTIGTAA